MLCKVTGGRLSVWEGPATALSSNKDDESIAGGGVGSPSPSGDGSLGIGACCAVPMSDSALCSEPGARSHLSEAAREEWWEYATGIIRIPQGFQQGH